MRIDDLIYGQSSQINYAHRSEVASLYSQEPAQSTILDRVVETYSEPGVKFSLKPEADTVEGQLKMF